MNTAQIVYQRSNRAAHNPSPNAGTTTEYRASIGFPISVMVLAFLTALVVLPGQASTLTIRFEKSAINATGLTPNGQVVFFGEALEDAPYMSVTYAHHERVVDADSSGTARYDLGIDVAPASVWGVVDVTSGQYAVVAPPGQRLKGLPTPPGLLKKNTAGDLTSLEVPFELAEILLVRPGVGAWEQFNAEGGPHDEPGHARGKTVSSVSHFAPVKDGKLKSVGALNGGDIVLIFEPRFLFFYAMRVDGR